ncbi:MAG: cytochrome c-type biogenesis protein CcmH [Actinomycetes bacterium]
MISRLHIRQPVAALLLALMMLGGPTQAIASSVHPTLAEVEDEVMCTVCGVPLSLAREAPAAKRERALILALIAQGQTKQQIEDSLVASYGPQVLATPKAEGFDLWAWLVPVLLIASAFAGLVLILLRWVRSRGKIDQSSESDSPVAPISGPDAAMVDQALRSDHNS